MRTSHANSLAMAFNLPKLFSSSPPFFFRLRLDSLCNANGPSALSSPNFPSLHSVFELNSSSPTYPPLPPMVSPSFGSSQAPSSPSQGSTLSHSLSVVRQNKMQRRQRMRSRRGGGGRGDGGRSSSGSRPPLSARDEADIQPSASNISSFIFRSELNRPRVTATITVAFQEEASDVIGQGSRARKRQMKSTISDKPPQVARKEIALPVKTASQTSGSDSSSSHTSSGDNSGCEETSLKSSNSPSSSKFSAHNPKENVDDSDEGYSYPIVEENPPHNNN